MANALLIAGSLFAAFLVLGVGNTVGYHRLLTHRAFVARGPTRTALTLLGAIPGGSPVVWVGLHRLHHASSDGPDDPHSPTRGFAWAHCGWLIGTTNPLLCALFAISGFGQQAAIVWHDLLRVAGRKPPVWRQLCPDLMTERLMRGLDAPGVMPALFAGQVAVVWLIAGGWGVLWLWIVHLLLTNASWSINSVCHSARFGSRPFDTKEGSRDVAWLARLTLGEGFHNSHHRYPRSARHAPAGGPDLSWSIIQGLCRLGLASDPWLPNARRR